MSEGDKYRDCSAAGLCPLRDVMCCSYNVEK
uniref:Uncharacterized protein n=1 Tax=Anguilla anguilla TaxID=7936 RepID=A0A0E9SS44_ANGAN